jgi:cation transport ATPase
MENHGTDADFAVAARTRIEARNRERERRAAKRSRREQILLWLLAPLGLPAAGAAAGIAVLDAAGGDLAGWPTASVVLVALAVFGVPAALTGWLARRRGRVEPFAWAAMTVAAEVALLFWVGLVALGYGPD